MHIRKAAAACAAVVILASSARGQSLTGTWTADYPASVRNVNGQITAENGTALLTLEQKGDSVFGTWQPQNTPRKVEPRRIVGAFKDGQLSFVAEPVEATIRRGGMDAADEKVMMRSFFEAKLEAGALAGTMRSQSDDGSISSPPMKWTAKKNATGS